jgi:CIC family chloride channel protein
MNKKPNPNENNGHLDPGNQHSEKFPWKRMLEAFRDQRHLLLDTVILGVVGAGAAQLFSWMLKICYRLFLSALAGYTAPGLPNEGGTLTQIIGSHGLLLIPISTTLGGLISGLLVYTFAPEAEGHGTDTAVKAFHFLEGNIRARIPFVKMLASAITIGSGGAAGREGPTALIAAGIGSIYASYTHRTLHERRILLLVGMAAGLAAIFRSPIGTAIFAVEVLYGGMEFEAGALIYTMLGSIVAYGVNGIFSGYQSIFLIPPNMAAPGLVELPGYILLGVAAGLLATVIPVIFYRIRDLFAWLPIPNHVKPAIGGLLLGLVAMNLPQVLSGGYGWIQMAIDGSLSTGLMLLLSFAMILAFSLTISSGGSGGVFAPSLFVGAMFGGFLAQAINQPSTPFVVLGMAAVFAGAARVPIATMLMVTEMTGGYTLLVPAGLSVMIAYLIEEALSRPFHYKSLYEAQVADRFFSPAHRLEQIENVFQLLNEQPVSVSSNFDHIDLRKLLITGIPIDLPGNRQMIFGAVGKDSKLIDTKSQAFFFDSTEDQIEVIAYFREGRLISPHSGLQFKAGDRVLAIATPTGQAILNQYLTRPENIILPPEH